MIEEMNLLLVKNSSILDPSKINHSMPKLIFCIAILLRVLRSLR